MLHWRLRKVTISVASLALSAWFPWTAATRARASVGSRQRHEESDYWRGLATDICQDVPEALDHPVPLVLTHLVGDDLVQGPELVPGPHRRQGPAHCPAQCQTHRPQQQPA